MSHAESVASSAVRKSLSPLIFFFLFFSSKHCHNEFDVFVKVRAAIKVRAAMIVVFTSSGGAARCVCVIVP